MRLFKRSMVTLLKYFLGSMLMASLAMAISPLASMISGEKDYFMVLTMCVVIDLLIGAMKDLKLHSFSFLKMLINLIIKVAVAYGAMLLFLSFANLEEGWAAEWFTLVAKFTVLLYPAGDTLLNMYILTEGRFPPLSFMKRMKAFDEVLGPTIRASEKKENMG